MIPILEIKDSDYLKVDQWIPEEIKTHEKRGSVYYCRLNLVPQILDRIAKDKEPVILVTDNGDITLSKIEETYHCHTANEICCQFAKNNISEYITQWFSTSLNVYEDLFNFLPLGILPQNYEILKEIAIKHQNEPRNNLLYSNFGLTSQHRLDLLAKMYGYKVDASPLELMKFAKIEWPPQVPWPEYGEYLKNYALNLLTSKFCLCPQGMGVDTYRLWESLYMSCIPIIINSQFAQNLQNLPILIVDQYEDISENFLIEKYNEITSKEYSLNNLKTSAYKKW